MTITNPKTNTMASLKAEIKDLSECFNFLHDALQRPVEIRLTHLEGRKIKREIEKAIREKEQQLNHLTNKCAGCVSGTCIYCKI